MTIRKRIENVKSETVSNVLLGYVAFISTGFIAICTVAFTMLGGMLTDIKADIKEVKGIANTHTVQLKGFDDHNAVVANILCIPYKSQCKE